jgi:hypothetical protein
MFLMDLTTVQMYLYYLEILKKLDKMDEVITHEKHQTPRLRPTH